MTISLLCITYPRCPTWRPFENRMNIVPVPVIEVIMIEVNRFSSLKSRSVLFQISFDSSVVKYLNVSRIKKYDCLALFTVFFSKVLHNM